MNDSTAPAQREAWATCVDRLYDAVGREQQLARHPALAKLGLSRQAQLAAFVLGVQSADCVGRGRARRRGKPDQVG